jgi:hypothetical protein
MAFYFFLQLTSCCFVFQYKRLHDLELPLRQLAQERGDLKNGVFTYSIPEYMEQLPSATVSELKNYVNK